MSVSPQGYNLGGEPRNENPFWGEGEDQDVNRIFMDVSITGGHGTPSASITKNISGHDILFSLLLKNLVGAPGEDGYSPSVTITNITGGHRITITDKTSTHTFDVMDGTPGTPGAPGAPGAPGENGISPDVTVTNITGGHRVTITDATGSESFDVMDGTPGAPGTDGTTPVITITATQDGEPVQVTKTGTDAAPNFNIALTGGGGSASGTIGWGNYGEEVAGKYPRAAKTEYKLDQPLVVNASGRDSVYIMGTRYYNWTLTGTIPTNLIVSTKYTPEMTPGSGPSYLPGVHADLSAYLTPTITPEEEQVTVDNIRIQISNVYVNESENSLSIDLNIIFDAHFSGEDMPNQQAYVNLKANAGEWSSPMTYAYLEVIPEA